MDRLFRFLRADEIDCRIGSINERGLTLLLYKDARCDMSILDETFGAMFWQRHHGRENANCIVSVYCKELGEWVEKEDTGTESNTEAEKGLASDSFKRACVNWGIGRELYTAPLIWISADNCEIKQKAVNGKTKYFCNDRFRVVEIGYNETGEINRLVISNDRKGVDVFVFPRKGIYTPEPKESQQKPAEAAVQPSEAPDGYYYCDSCGSVISGIKQSGKSYTPKDVAIRSLKKYQTQLCWECQKQHEKQTG